MRLVTVGTGTVVPDPARASACFWLEHRGTRVVIDCGAGAIQGLARARLPWGRIDHVLISHFHADHIAEIPPLIFALRHALEVPRREPLGIVGPEGTRDLFHDLAAAFGPWVTDPGFPVEIREARPDRSLEVGSLVLKVASTPHTPESVGLRLEAGGRGLGYTGDTGPDDALSGFFQGVDLLLAECSLPDDLVGTNHLSPSRLARLAVDAGVERLAVTHIYPQLRQQDVEGLLRAAGYGGEVILVWDGQELEV